MPSNSMPQFANELSPKIKERMLSIFEGARAFSEVIDSLSSEGAPPPVQQLRDLALHIEHFVLEMQLSLLSMDCCPDNTKLKRLAAARVIHSIFELKQAQDQWFNKKVLSLSVALGVEIDSADIRSARKSLAHDLKIIDSWSEVRNTTTGHYSADIQLVEAKVSGIDVTVVQKAAAAQLAFLYAVMECVRTKWKQRSGESKRG